MTFQGAVPEVAGGRDSVVGTGTLYRLHCPGLTPVGDFPYPSRLAPRPYQPPPIEWTGGLFLGGKAAGAWRRPPTSI